MGVGFLPLLAIAFNTLKLVGVVGWSWWWILAPIWIPALLGVCYVAIGSAGKKKSHTTRRRK